MLGESFDVVAALRALAERVDELAARVAALERAGPAADEPPAAPATPAAPKAARRTRGAPDA